MDFLSSLVESYLSSKPASTVNLAKILAKNCVYHLLQLLVSYIRGTVIGKTGNGLLLALLLLLVLSD